MDKNALIQKLKTRLPGSVLRAGAFGRSRHISVWVELGKLPEIAAILRKGEPGLAFDWLENVSVMEIEGSLVLSYFLRSRAAGETLILRASVAPAKADAVVDAPTMVPVWPEAEPMEAEAAELFGIRFTGGAGAGAAPGQGRVLPAGWAGFPMRKSYRFPDEVDGIPHSRSRPPEVNQ